MIERVVDRAGFVWATLAWDGDRLRTLEVPGARVDGAVIDDPLLGRAHVITAGDASTTMSAIDWAKPTQIPTVADPAKLAGAGATIMNVIAMLAREAGTTCRYAGRYPTSALYRTLTRCFRATASEDDFVGHFRLAGPETEIAIDFVPAPFERLYNAHGFVEIRDGLIERAVIDRVSYEPDGSPARLRPIPILAGAWDRATTRVCAELWFGDALYAQVATLEADGRQAGRAQGSMIDGPLPIPRCESAVLGRSFPPALVVALAELVAEVVPAPIAEDARAYLTKRILRWADLGPQVAAETPEGFAIHAVLWDRIAPLGLGRLALALAEALGPVVTRVLVRALARDVAVISRPS